MAVAGDPRIDQETKIMTKLRVNSVLAGVATVAALTIAVSGSALAHGGGMGGHMGGSMGHNTVTMTKTGTTTVTKIDKVTNIGDRDRRRFRFRRFGYVGVAASPVCFYKWTSLGRVRICPDLDY
jgi:hypothetical protein